MIDKLKKEFNQINEKKKTKAEELKEALQEKTKFIIDYNENGDIRNRHSACNSTAWWIDRKKRISATIYENIHGKTLNECKEYLIKHIHEHHRKNLLEHIKKVQEEFEDKNTQKILIKLQEIMGHKIPFATIKVLLTSFPRGPYDAERWLLYVYYRKWKHTDSLLHETMHFIFENNFNHIQTKKILTSEEFWDLKEAQTIILNDEFPEYYNDDWYPGNEKLCKALADQRRKERDFEKLIEFGVDYIKQQRKK